MTEKCELCGNTEDLARGLGCGKAGSRVVIICRKCLTDGVENAKRLKEGRK